MLSLTKWFTKPKQNTPQAVLEKLLNELLEKGNLLLSFQISVGQKDKEVSIDIFGEDEGLLKAKDGRLLLALQTYFSRVIQHYFPGEEWFVRLDSHSYFEQKDQRLLSLAQKLKKKALFTGQPVYFKSLPPFQRRKIHQFLAGDKEVQTTSVGDGFYKNICITPQQINRSV